MPASLGADVPDAATVYAPREPVDLMLTLAPLRHGPRDPTFHREAGDVAVWRTARGPTGVATLRLVQRRDGAVSALAWGRGATWAIDGVPELLGAGDDWSGVDVSTVPLLAETRRRRVGMRLTRCREVFATVFAAVLEQEVATVDAHRSWARLLARHGDPAPGPAPLGMRVVPAAETVRCIPSWEWHQAGVDPKRSRTVVECARASDGLERTLELGRGGAEVARRLRSLPGIGIWTAAETTQRAHGDPDAPSIGDLHLPGVVGHALVGHEVDDAGMLELLEPWRGDRHRVVRLITASGVRPARRAPRLARQDHRFH